MASKRAARREVIKQHGRGCFLCGRGPLERRALNLVVSPIGGRETVPVCTKCRDMLAEGIDYPTARARVQELCDQYDNMVSAFLNLGMTKFQMPRLLRDTFTAMREENAELKEELRRK